MNVPILPIAVAFLITALVVRKRWPVMTRRRWLAVVLALTLGGLGLAWEAYFAWYQHRGQPPPVREAWFQGVSYERMVERTPHALVAHVVRIRLDAPGVDLLVTPAPADGGSRLPAKKTSEFARQNRVQLAINTQYFAPFRWVAPFWYYPHDGDPVHPVGLVASRGNQYGGPARDGVTMFISRSREVSFEAPRGAVWNAVTGLGYLVKDGVAVRPPPQQLDDRKYDRTALGVDRAGTTLFAVVVDARQPSYSEGVTVEQLSRLLLRLGVHTAIQLDGGGSSTLVKRGADGRVRLVNSPSNFCMPWWERAVATHLGIYAKEL